MIRAAIYARFSSELQNARSIDDQVDLCRTYCCREGYAPIAIFSDRAMSGASTIGPNGLDQLLDGAAKQQFGVVVVEALDRLSRDMADLATIYKMLRFAGVQLIAVHDGKADDIAIGVRGLVGALYLTDLAHKTRRGLAGKLKQGMRAGGLPYGYRPILGKPGEHEIFEPEALVVRKIFKSYADGSTPREIAAQLNLEGIEPVRGRAWNASTINGSTKRASGMLSNEVYAGRIVWNRVGKIKNPMTGKRVPRINDRAEWHRIDAPQLRIVDDELFQAVAERQAERRTGPHSRVTPGPKRMLSGLLKCAACGSGIVSAGSDHGRPVAQCTRVRESGDCKNKRKVYLDVIEEAVVHGLRDYLRHPKVITDAVREYHAERRRLAAQSVQERSVVERRLVDVEKQMARLVDALASGTLPVSAIGPKLNELENEKRAIAEKLASLEPDEVVAMHPKAIEIYLAAIDRLASSLASGADKEALCIVRELVSHITVFPREKGAPVVFEIAGRLAALLKPSVGSLVPRGGLAAALYFSLESLSF
ncbi:recombinase family protein [Lichenifustis flavocetrariae]|uniref:Recombinase family protein n=1 Tax=Lichenifustis flavocetrariae TaxID=2949735 RepID=A0AA41Z461_9HYPH|nr:recombinase family protein [Lichenifustis flavocetrariae]MCW6512613.1 recombinase family protein [Lichenifustis flavocetrariae]